ncbi:tryptophan synthase subunit beta [Bacillus luteus]|uniref:Multifunctional fusion protein n=2 Tax=Alkalicoccus luteus TaxID=1237094 RepID=A0A969TVN6_9BACI|nr:tryptophan synthase subunit beta [Alkalicoccus luteus]
MLKFCGTRHELDYQKAVAAGPDFIGFIFADSPRKADPDDVARWIAGSPLSSAKPVGVFVNEDLDHCAAKAVKAGLEVIQLHGTESADYAAELKQKTGCQIWKTIHHAEDGLMKMKRYRDVADGYVIDTKTAGAWGGTGAKFDWNAVPEYIQEADFQGVPAFIAGGVNPENAAELAEYKPHGIDVSSGIETNGQNDERKMISMVRTVKNHYQAPDELGRFGDYGGRYVPETLMFALEELEESFRKTAADENYLKELHQELHSYSGRPTGLTYAARLSGTYGGADIYLKREDLNHTGAHKINNAIAQALLAKRMGKTQIIAETGAGQHGVASATAAARFGLSCKVFMGREDIKRQELNVFRMKLLGAEVIEVTSGGMTLKDATNEAIKHWVAHVEDTFYLIGSAVGPHPYPEMVRHFQSVIGEESRRQMLESTGKLPDHVVACVGGGSNAMGMFYPFINDDGVSLTGVEAAGRGVDTDQHAATLARGRKGVLHGSMSYLLQDEYGNITEPYSISAGLDYPGIGPEHAHLKDIGRVNYVPVSDDEAMEALKDLCELEGILPAIETAHALAYVKKLAPEMKQGESILVSLSGRGDKDVNTIRQAFEEDPS